MSRRHCTAWRMYSMGVKFRIAQTHTCGLRSGVNPSDIEDAPDTISSFTGEYAWLSNFYYSKVTHDGITYPSVEHAYQAAKTLNVDTREFISEQVRNPGQAKKYGRTLTLREDWEEVKLQVMEECLLSKFSNSELADMLLGTGNQELVEGNYWKDHYWGVCNGFGQNHLGKLLMKIRNKLKQI